MLRLSRLTVNWRLLVALSGVESGRVGRCDDGLIGGSYNVIVGCGGLK